MPNETTTTTDTRDAQIASLKAQVQQLQDDNTELLQELQELDEAENSRAATPTGNYCVLDGKTYEVASTVTCRFATDEGRKGHIDIDSELVVLKR